MIKRMKKVLGVIILGIVSLCSCSNVRDAGNDNNTSNKKNAFNERNTSQESFADSESILSEVFTVGNHSVSIMEIRLPSDVQERMNDIYKRFQSGIKKNPKWFNNYLKQHSISGEQLPWNEKFGISEDEYDEYISSVDKMRLKEMKKTTMTIIKDNEGILTLKSNDDLPYLSEIKIDTKNNCMITELGIVEYNKEIVASDNQKVTGPWNGGLWKVTFEELKDINNIDKTKTYGYMTISVGRLEKSNKIMIYYKEKAVHEGYRYKGTEIIVFDN